MSIPVRFDWYSESGELLAANRGCFTISYGQDLSNLTVIGKRLQECDISLHQRFIHPDVRYAVPCHSPDYMFDLRNLTHVLPNKFKENLT
jgi:hypothetical protein